MKVSTAAAPAVAVICLLFRVAEALTAADLTVIQRGVRTVVAGANVSTMVRLAFHDCVGGCNGCININNPDNNGLKPLAAGLDAVYVANNFSRLLSRADFWAYAAIFAVQNSVASANANCRTASCVVPDPGLVFKYGRKDCPTAPFGGNETLPSSNLNYKGMMDYFAKEFNFTSAEVVALMGVHTLGEARTNNSGFFGKWWLTVPNQMNNAFYQILRNSSMTWTQRNISPAGSTPHYQWNGVSSRPPGFMLNTDMALYKDVQLDSAGLSSCTFSTCPAAPTAALVDTYANSLSAWVGDFGRVFTKMLAHGTTVLNTL